MTTVQLQRLTRNYGDQLVLDALCLNVESGSYLVLLGPSGCGKTTTLRIIAGLEQPDGGEVVFDGANVTAVPPRKRDVSMVFQQDGLYPHLNVGQAIRFALRGRCPASEINDRFRDAVALTGVDALLEQFPSQLSGGELRRAAIASVIAKRTAVRLLDEPLSALDVAVRQGLQDDILRWHRSVPGTTIHVTHDGREAMRVADRIAVMDGGRIVQFGIPADVFDQPETVAVAKSIGIPVINWIEAELIDGMIFFNEAAIKALPSFRVNAQNQSLLVGVRPDDFCPCFSEQDGTIGGGIVTQASLQECRVVESRLQLRVHAGRVGLTVLTDQDVSSQLPPLGGSLELLVEREKVHVFSKSSGRRVKVSDVG